VAWPFAWKPRLKESNEVVRRGTLGGMDTSNLDARTLLALGVIRRCLAGEGVELKQMTLTHYEPSLHRCHDNVREFVEKYPAYTQVRGFFVANRQPLADTTLVIAHSAVGAPDGTLNDITPSELDVRHPFVLHDGTLEEFESVADSEPFMVEVPNDLVRELLKP
jgi:hypothetical protein